MIGFGIVIIGECVDGFCGGLEVMFWFDDEWGEGGEEFLFFMMFKVVLFGKIKYKIMWNLMNLGLMFKGNVFWII